MHIGNYGRGQVNTTTSQPQDDYQTVADGLERLAWLNKQGLNDSEEANKVRDQLDAPWHRLSAADQQLLKNYSVWLRFYYAE